MFVCLDICMHTLLQRCISGYVRGGSLLKFLFFFKKALLHMKKMSNHNTISILYICTSL